MNQKKLSPELLKNLTQLEEERKRDEIDNEKYKSTLSKEIKGLDRSIIKNTEFIEQKYTTWQRILRVLGIN
jgi:superfamily II RNA helicase